MAEEISDPLMHYGVLGMKWGVRKDGRPQGYGNPNFIKRRQQRKDQKARALRGRTGEEIRKTRSGNYQTKSGKTVSKDAAAARGQQKKAQLSGSDALTNKELQSLVNRMNLEQQYDRLTTPSQQKSAGKQFIDFLKTNKKAQKQIMAAGTTAFTLGKATIELRKMIDEVDLSKL